METDEIKNLIFTHEHAAALGKDRGPSHAKAVEFHRQSASALRFLLQEREWKDISSAPKDGKQVLLYGRYWSDSQGMMPAPMMGRYSADRWEVCAFHEYPFGVRPTHWRPLPSPPQRQGDRPEKVGE